ncbi:MAG: glycosyltransferase [Candidatus Kerfeldbacteria bacterium]|nr:glycosyltransferase [Candidatus Kerfeldbacteria bacterium]
MADPLYSIVISCYNEQQQVQAVIRELVDHLDARGIDFELVLVNNGSTDGTPAILESLARQDQRISVVTLFPNATFGGGTLAGLRRARGAFIGFTTAGGQVSPKHVLAVYETARQHPSAVVKGRRVTRESWSRRLSAWGYGLAVNALFAVGTADVDGYPLVLPKATFDALGIRSGNLMLNVEVLLGAKRHGLRVIRVPVPYAKRAGGRSHTTLRVLGQFLYQLVEYRLQTLARPSRRAPIARGQDPVLLPIAHATPMATTPMKPRTPIEGVKVIPLKQIPDERGKVMHMLKATDPHFLKFGEIYFSIGFVGAIKAWHIHKRMTLNNAVMSGRIKLVLYDGREHSPTKGAIMELFIGEDNYCLVQIPPGITNGYKAYGDTPAILANCATEPYDPDEIIRIDPVTGGVPYDWDLKHG